jgi:hypothetical protein
MALTEPSMPNAISGYPGSRDRLNSLCRGGLIR